MRPNVDIAIVGMACVFPKAPDLATFWENILAKVDAVTDAPPDWSAEDSHDPPGSSGDPIYTKRGGFLGELARFNPFDYGVLPRSIDGSDPEHFIALRVAHEALADAGYLNRAFNRERTAVILGCGAHPGRGYATVLQHTVGVDQTIRVLAALHPEHSTAELAAIKRELLAGLPPFDPDTAPGLIPSVMCGRIANRLDLMGPAYTVDAACAGSLVAVEHAMSKLASGEVDMALAGGVHLSSSFAVALFFCQTGAMSRGGQVRSFSADADGALLGEGAGVLVLKRREDAERDGDRVYALLKAVGVASDGRAVGPLASRVEGEELAIRRAYEQAGIDPSTVSLIEGCGLGTPVADTIELDALSRVFGAGDGSSCALGSIKSMIGHPLPAGGVAGIIKTALALHHRVLPPTLHAEAGNPKLGATPFYLNTETRPWIHAGPEPRHAAVSAFGLGGINAHALLEEHHGHGTGEHLHRRLGAEVVIVSASDRVALLARIAEVRQALAAEKDLTLVDFAATLNCPQDTGWGAARLAIVATCIADLDTKLANAQERLADPACDRIFDRSGIYWTEAPLYTPGTVAFLFPGMGAQYVNMLADLCLHFPEARSWFDLIDRVFSQHWGGDLPSRAIFPPPGGPGVADHTALWAMDRGPAAVLAANQALASLLSRLAIRPDAVLGYSTGTLSALGAAGAVRVDDEAELVRHVLAVSAVYKRLRDEHRIPTGALLAVATAERERVRSLTRRSEGAVTLAMDNCPHQVVLGGGVEAIAAAADELAEAGVRCTLLPVDRAYHTPAFAEVSARLQRSSEPQLGPPQLPLYSCVTAARCPTDPEALGRIVADEYSQPVRFREAIEAMHASGARIFVEVGPGGRLTGFVDDILRGREHLAVPADVAHHGSTVQLAHLVGLLAAHHVPMDLEPLYTHRSPRRCAIRGDQAGHVGARPSGKDDRWMQLTVELPVLTLDRPTPARAAPAAGGAAGAAPTAPASGGGRHEQVIQAYLDTMERFLDVQRQAMQALLRTDGGREPLADTNGARQAPARFAPEPGPGQGPMVGLRPEDLAQTVLKVVCDRTGYPRSGIDLSADMEADLGLDSIKRVEILGVLQQEHGLPDDGDMERLAGARTLRQLIDALQKGAEDAALLQD
jgi:acyl transferase domain-containing protein/acyl carrier protein